MTEVPAHFVDLIATITGRIGDRPVEPALADFLATEFPVGDPLLEELQTLCKTGCEEGWLCAREAGGIKFGRPVKPGPETHGFSVDVVEMDDIAGPHHSHPNGEIDLVMPYDEGAAFDGVATGWKVYGPGSAHKPTVTGGRALVLYLLPQGAIEFTRA